MPTYEPQDPDWVLLHRYLAGEANVDERAQVERWVSADPANRELIESMRRITEALAAPRASRFDAAAGRARLESSLRGAQRRSNLLPRHTGFASARSGLAMTTLVAACVAVALMVLHRGRVESREFVTRAGQRQSVTLSDGTQFTLAPASRLSVPVDYASGDRAVTLDGEAFFAVVHDAAHPFSVRAGNVVATDIGTRFDVRAYGDDRDVRVAVGEGEVRIDARAGRGRSSTVPLPRPYNGNDTILARGDVALVSGTVLTIAHGADVSTMTAWTHGELVFVDTPVPDVLRELGRWYDVDARAQDSALLARRVTLEAPSEEPDRVFGTLAAVLHARVDRSGRRVTFSY